MKLELRGVDLDLGKCADVRQPNWGPALPAVGGLEDAGTQVGVDVVAHLARCCVQHVGIVGVDCQGTEGERIPLVEERLPAPSPVRCAPDPPGSSADVDPALPLRVMHHRADSPSNGKGSDSTPPRLRTEELRPTQRLLHALQLLQCSQPRPFGIRSNGKARW
jgi:hypothetical protein